MRLRIQRLHPDAELPAYAHGPEEDAGLDLKAVEDALLEPRKAALVPTGLAIELPPGYEAQIRPRSGLAVKHGIGMINSPGTIDADYRGEVMIAVINLGPAAYTVRRGDRIAQMVIQRVHQARLEEVGRLEPTDRSTGGFGHTGR